MTDAAAFKATFADWRTVKGRKQLQLIFEVPLEQQGHVLEILGAPDPTNPAWCGVALLKKEALQGASAPVTNQSSPVNTREKKRFNELPLSQQAALKCEDRAFRRFLIEMHAGTMDDNAESAADVVRMICGVSSRSLLDRVGSAASEWRALIDRYEAWMRAAV